MSGKHKITVVGNGYVGMSIAVLLAQHNDVTALDIDEARIELINQGKSTVVDKEIEQYLGENENYSTGEKFIITPQDIKFLRSLEPKKANNHKNLLVLLESGDVVLNYNDTISYYSGSHIDVCFGGSHSYESIDKKLEKILHFTKI